MSLYSQDDYAQSLHSLLPNGRAWPREKGSVQYAVLKALGERSPDLIRVLRG
jgi:uncharacterized protein YmfQ (DUF2313 family)